MQDSGLDMTLLKSLQIAGLLTILEVDLSKVHRVSNISMSLGAQTSSTTALGNSLSNLSEFFQFLLGSTCPKWADYVDNSTVDELFCLMLRLVSSLYEKTRQIHGHAHCLEQCLQVLSRFQE